MTATRSSFVPAAPVLRSPFALQLFCPAVQPHCHCPSPSLASSAFTWLVDDGCNGVGAVPIVKHAGAVHELLVHVPQHHVPGVPTAALPVPLLVKCLYLEREPAALHSHVLVVGGNRSSGV